MQRYLLLLIVCLPVVLAAAPDHRHPTTPAEMDHSHHHTMDHDMDHDGMDHDGMDHDGMDHDGMDPSMHGNMSHGMAMYFHFRIKETVLFKGWQVTTVGGMIASVVGVFLMAMLYEGLKYFREYLFKQYVSTIQFSTVAITGENGKVSQVHKVEKHRMLSSAHAIQTTLHMIQLIVSYFLMLIFMTYNVWLCLGVVFGAGVGYFIFGWKKASVVDITEHCH